MSFSNLLAWGGEAKLLGPESVQLTTENVNLISERMKTAQVVKRAMQIIED